ncbi:XRE family transcriptional regulator [Nocardia brasiliensis]|uniref:XRE family transcriptional regulator n=1 Tax=Nocardia brasiliensis TaxID=37326 RepID=UPI0024561BC0|nr:XRE family transcriptional regulator [Nocardia brasiliensis]
MPNDRLRDALIRNGLDVPHVAAKTGVDEKTVERWITKGRTPYPRHRHTIAALVCESENYLWPDAVSAARRTEAGESEVIRVYPHRSAIPSEVWTRLLEGTEDELDILVLAGLFLAEEAAFGRLIRRKSRDGLKVRMLFGNPQAAEATKRSGEERLAPGTVSARIRNALALIEPLSAVEGVEVRFHDTTLYNSIFRFDDEMIVNAHVYGFPGAHAPALHLRRLPAGDLFATYATSFDHVWTGASPANFLETR